MKRLNQREIEVAKVAVDLLRKGNPETRIAEYCHLKKMTRIQVGNFLQKLPSLPEPVRMTILNTFRDLETGVEFDHSREQGYALNLWLRNNKY